MKKKLIIRADSKSNIARVAETLHNIVKKFLKSAHYCEQERSDYLPIWISTPNVLKNYK